MTHPEAAFLNLGFTWEAPDLKNPNVQAGQGIGTCQNFWRGTPGTGMEAPENSSV